MDVEAFIQRWSQARGGAERANYQMFLTELCEALELPRPAPASHASPPHIDLHKRGPSRALSVPLRSIHR